MPGSPHPAIRRRRQGSPHPIAITADEMEPESRSTTPEPSRNGSNTPAAKPQVAPNHIPQHVGMAPAIYVPATFDFTKPRSLPSSPERTGSSSDAAAAAAAAANPSATSLRVDRALTDLEDHMTAVKRNISTLTLQEARRCHQEAAAREMELADAGQPTPRSKRLPPTREEERQMLKNLEGRSVRGVSYGVPAEFGPAFVPGIAPHPKDTPREAVTTQILDLLRYGGFQLDGYESFCATSRRVTAARVKQDIAQEVARSLAQNQGDDLGEKTPVANVGEVQDNSMRMDID
ncbi:hypothetical protein PFICI_08513 [Pestalotiopsis fici W106-1]|uniref:Uncharacterized protein n=1 Tax=Pestalotiopsis fici (strain W106-1 / CGMCC3.15140) TaxID=1229662 RepID=W3WXU6_PESFW|nr:uncharacterized protein PFICI_08513 [Pestalotiopsis fici W106-1]ETS78660.1 hypothetical protein PFICI_08513 [Pestalotiopsis fici W106-1]